jgi:hypothetical protein
MCGAALYGRHEGAWRVADGTGSLYYSTGANGLRGPPQPGYAWSSNILAYPPTPANITCR